MTQPTRAEQLDAEFVQFQRDNPTVYPQVPAACGQAEGQGH